MFVRRGGPFPPSARSAAFFHAVCATFPIREYALAMKVFYACPLAVTVVISSAAILFSQTAEAAASEATKQIVVRIEEVVSSKSTTREELVRLAEYTRRGVPENCLVQQLLAPEYFTSASPARLRDSLSEAAGILAFKPVEEAPLPEGFPILTPVGEIRILDYPAYRVARTPISYDDSVAFFRLFRHIESRDIAMTAPVEVTYAEEDGKLQEKQMAFLYRSTKQGETGEGGKVQVIDVPAQRVVSIGCRGDADQNSVDKARQMLEDWLESHAAEYVAAGDVRVMGHNSPFIAKRKRYFEVQVPVQPRPGR